MELGLKILTGLFILSIVGIILTGMYVNKNKNNAEVNGLEKYKTAKATLILCSVYAGLYVVGVILTLTGNYIANKNSSYGSSSYGRSSFYYF